MKVISRLDAINDTINKAKKNSPLASASVNLIAVSKGQAADVIMPLLEAGHRSFAENRVQEAEDKWPPLRAIYPDINLHLIGSLQSNKVKQALALFDAIHTIDRPALVDAIIKECEKTAMRCTQFFVQVNTGEEPQKGGVVPSQLPELMEYIKAASASLLPRRFIICGLMCVPPVVDIPAPHFAFLRELAQQYDLPFLSMGMSSDYEKAVRLGATHIRVGTAVFGERKLT